jgi:hypothetical protein
MRCKASQQTEINREQRQNSRRHFSEAVQSKICRGAKVMLQHGCSID